MKLLPIVVLLIAVLGCSSGSQNSSTTSSGSGSNSASTANTGLNSASSGKSGQVEAKVPEVGLVWQVPADWRALDDCGRGEAGCKAYYISPDAGGGLDIKYEVEDDDTSPDELLQKLYDGGLKGKEKGNYSEVKKTTIGGLQGVEVTGARPDQREFIFQTVVRSQGKIYLVIAGAVGTDDYMNRQDELLKILHSMKELK